MNGLQVMREPLDLISRPAVMLSFAFVNEMSGRSIWSSDAIPNLFPKSKTL
jgi:hypothetical protein